jgi:hypothetical protein
VKLSDKCHWFVFGAVTITFLDALKRGSKVDAIVSGICVAVTVFCEVAQWAAKKYLARRA